MIAPRQLPDSYRHWNLVHGAPHGRELLRSSLVKWLFSKRAWERRRGPFAIQGNNPTRAFEYPWAFQAAGIQPGMRVLEVGGSLSGFQFVLSELGCSVVNVDPGLEATGVGWPCDQNSLRELNALFGTSVELRNCVIEEAALEEGTYDRVFSVSVLEHLPEKEITEVMKHAYRCLKPGGLFILTVDLFLNLKPFTDRETNEYGRNQDLRWLIAQAPFERLEGKSSELFGFPEFDSAQIQRDLDRYLIGYYPVLIQCVVLRKPAN